MEIAITVVIGMLIILALVCLFFVALFFEDAAWIILMGSGLLVMAWALGFMFESLVIG